jgi:flagellar basal body-associated protein FliL
MTTPDGKKKTWIIYVVLIDFIIMGAVAAWYFFARKA